MQYKLGKRPATHDPRDLQFEHYRRPDQMHRSLTDVLKGHCVKPKPPNPSPVAPPSDLDNAAKIGAWGMLGNDQYGDCVFAGADHETMLWTTLGGKSHTFSDTNALADYSAVTGFNKSDPKTDQGTDVRQALSYRQKTGVADSVGIRHKIAAYASLEPGNTAHVQEGVYWFDAVGIGFEFPDSAMSQFNKSQPWSVVQGAQIEGGHYVPVIGYDAQYLYCVTWGAVQRMTWSFFAKYTDEAYALLSQEYLVSGKSPDGFDLTALLADLKTL